MSAVVLALGLAVCTSDPVFLATEPVTRTGPQAEPDILEDVIVEGRRGAGLVEPEVEIDRSDIDLLGEDDIGDVIRRLVEDYALGDAPIVVVNGRRIADPGVFSRFPPDALVRVEVLPSEAGSLYGADDSSRRVVNIVLQRRFSSLEGRTSVRRPTAGGQSSTELGVLRSSIIDTRTRQMGLDVQRDTALTVGEREVITDLGVDRATITLRPAAESVSASLVETASVGDWAVSFRANGRASESRAVLQGDGEVFESYRRSRGVAVTAGLTGDAWGWSTRIALDGLLADGEQTGLYSSRSRQQSLTASLGVSRPLFTLQRGVVTATMSARHTQYRSTNDTDGGRRTVEGQASGVNGGLSIPLLRRTNAGSEENEAVSLVLNLGGEAYVQGSARAVGLNGGLAWTPFTGLRLSGNWARSNQPIDDSQKLEPEYYGNPIRVFDFRAGQAVDVLPRLGGTPDLRFPRADRIVVLASFGPFSQWDVQTSVGFYSTRSTDGLGVLLTPTPAIEAAFPDRFQRDAAGRLTVIDARPLNFDRAVSDTVSSSLAFRLPSVGRSRMRLVLNHSVLLRNTTTIRESLPQMDRLVGDGGGMPRQTFSLAVDATLGGWRANVAARFREGFRTRRDAGADGPDDLRVDGSSTIDLKIGYRFARSGVSTDRLSWTGGGLQLELEIANLFDTRPSASLGDGRAARGYGRDDQDPIGRTALLSVKRRF